MNLSIRDQLAELAGTRQWVQLHRIFPGQSVTIGVVLELGFDLVLVQQYHDFYQDGYAIFRVDDLVSIRANEADRFWTEMMVREGRLDEVGINFKVDLDDMRSCLSSLCDDGQRCVILECEDPEDEANDHFTIGRLLSVGWDSASILPFDILGRWAEEPIEIELDEITYVQFETPYIKTFSKYAH